MVHWQRTKTKILYMGDLMVHKDQGDQEGASENEKSEDSGLLSASR